MTLPKVFLLKFYPLLHIDIFSIALRDYYHVEVDALIRDRLCINISIINNFVPSTTVQLSLKATSSSHNVTTVPSVIVIVDDGELLFAVT